MSYSAGIYIDSENSLEALADDVSRLLEVDLRAINDDGHKVYEHSYPDFLLRVYADHGVVNDQGSELRGLSVCAQLMAIERLRSRAVR